MLPVVVAHGGAGYIPKEQAESASVGVREATRKGYAILKSGGSAVDAVVEAVTILMQTNHVCLAADGASQFARAMGIPEVPGESLITDYAIKRWQDNLLPDADPPS